LKLPEHRAPICWNGCRERDLLAPLEGHEHGLADGKQRAVKVLASVRLAPTYTTVARAASAAKAAASPKAFYWKYPVKSRMKWTVPAELLMTEIVPDPSVANCTIALLARAREGPKLIEEVVVAVK